MKDLTFKKNIEHKTLIKECHIQNVNLIKKKLAIHTFGNISCRLEKNYFVIKPSGTNLSSLKFTDYPIVRISDGKIVSGKLKPSSDTPTHLFLYKNYAHIGAISHTHSKFATAWSQASRPIPILGTTHADYSKKNIPITAPLKNSQLSKDYEYNTGKAIKDCLKINKLDPSNCLGVLVRNHAPFCWGRNAQEAFNNSEILEYIAELAFISITINSKSKISKNLINKHFSRKHGKKSYYGQR